MESEDLSDSAESEQTSTAVWIPMVPAAYSNDVPPVKGASNVPRASTPRACCFLESSPLIAMMNEAKNTRTGPGVSLVKVTVAAGVVGARVLS